MCVCRIHSDSIILFTYVFTLCTLSVHLISTQGEDVRYLVTKIFDYVREQFVKGKASSAKNFILNAALVAQNKHALGLLDKVNTCELNSWCMYWSM